MFSIPQSSNIYILEDAYSIPLVVLSILIACWAAFTALSMNRRIQQNSFFHQGFWLSLASIAMGAGIWAMHFVGMSAMILPITVQYDVLLTLASAIPAMVASYLFFYFANHQGLNRFSFILAGAIMGIGISCMHYIGMAAMKMDAQFSYRPWIFIASIAIAIIVSYISLLIFTTLQKYMARTIVKIITSVVMGIAIASMHYTGMFAVVIYRDTPLAVTQHHMMDNSLLITVVTVSIAFLLLIGGLTSLLDRYVNYRLFHFDPLTLLPNQRLFEQKVKQSSSAGRLAIIHIHNLEKWNNKYGYTFGDHIIHSVSEVIQIMVPNTWNIYRIEGHRFAVIQPDKKDYKKLKSVIAQLMSTLKHPMTINHQPIKIETVCATAAPNEKVSLKMQHAHCLNVLKHPTINYNHEHIPYDPRVHLYSFEKQMIEGIHHAMEHHELYLEYQPKISTQTGNVSGLEALIRWKHPEHGVISPGIFIPILENSDEIFLLTDWIIEKVCKQIMTWTNNGVPFRQVSINIPGAYVTSPKLQQVIRQNLLKYNVNSQHIELEITETSVIDSIEDAIDAVNHFRGLGLSVALDDFGTGLSSLSNLRRIPINTVKIDKSFMDGTPKSDKDSAVLRSIVKLCASLHLKIIIEGVETKEQMAFILSLKEPTQVQGFFFSRPLAADDVVEWVWRGVSDKFTKDGLT